MIPLRRDRASAVVFHIYAAEEFIGGPAGDRRLVHLRVAGRKNTEIGRVPSLNGNP